MSTTHHGVFWALFVAGAERLVLRSLRTHEFLPSLECNPKGRVQKYLKNCMKSSQTSKLVKSIQTAKYICWSAYILSSLYTFNKLWCLRRLHTILEIFLHPAFRVTLEWWQKLMSSQGTEHQTLRPCDEQGSKYPVMSSTHWVLYS